MTAELVKQKGDEIEHDAANAPMDRIRVAPNTVSYVKNHKLVVEFAIPGAPTETLDVKMLEDAHIAPHLTSKDGRMPPTTDAHRQDPCTLPLAEVWSG